MTTAESGDRAAAGDRRGLALVLAAVLAYALLHSGFRLAASASLGEDDPLASLLAQNVRLGYLAPRPPLYEWLVWAVQRVTGPGIAGFLVIKYGALVATCGFLYASSMRVHGERVWAFLTVESLALIYQIAWRYHEGFAHEIVAMVAVAATVWAALRVVTEGGRRDYLALGLGLGAGLLSTFAYWAFVATLGIAAALQRPVRARLRPLPLAATLLLAAFIAAPYLYWLTTVTEPVAWVEQFSPSYWRNLGKGVLDALRGPLFYLSPLIVIVPLMFRGALAVALADVRRKPAAGETPDLSQLVLHQALGGIALSVAGAVLVGAAGYAMHALMPLYLASVIWLMDVARRASAGDAGQRTRFARFALLIAVIALSARLANMFVLDPVCKICRWGVPYEGLAAELRQQGGTAELRQQGGSAELRQQPAPTRDLGAIVALDPETGGNLRARLPAVPVYLPGYPGLSPTPAQLRGRTVAFVWRPQDEALAVARIAALLPPDKAASAVTVDVPWRHLWRPTGYRSQSWRVLVWRD